MGSREPATSEEFGIFEHRAARGGWTISRELAAIMELRALLSPLGFPVRVPKTSATTPPWVVVVQRREWVLAERLRVLARPDVPVIWDRRDRDRRAIAGPVALDRRRRDRRAPPPSMWGTLRFLVVRLTDPIL